MGINSHCCEHLHSAKPTVPRANGGGQFALIVVRWLTLSRHSLAIFLGVWGMLAASTAIACAVAVRLGEDATIKDEAALIIWDPETQTEHFIRSANILTDSPDLGFLVPTPTIPSLHDTSGHTFHYLQELTAAKIDVRYTEDRRFRLFAPDTWFGSHLSPSMRATNSIATPAAVDVIGQQQVGAYDASILKASDADSLRHWLVDHKYTIPDSLQEWLDIYVSQGWYITAFKLSKSSEPESKQSMVVARPVRLTFKTEKPFYPYREPAGVSGKTEAPEKGTDEAGKKTSRLLRIFFLSNQRFDATIGTTAIHPANTVWAGHLADWQLGNISHNVEPRVPADEQFKIPPHLTILTELEDPSSPRQGTDELFFAPSNDQSYKERTPIIREQVRVTYAPNIPQWTLFSIPLVISSILAIRVLRRR